MSVRIKTVWAPQPGPQTTLLRCPVFEILYGGARGGGKGVLYNEQILTPFGWKSFQSLEVGSSVCSTEGTVQRVIGVYPQGKVPIYRLKWSDGSETICDENHIWLAWLSNQSRKSVGSRLSGEDSAKKWTTKQIADHYKKDQKIKRRIGIPVIKKPVVFTVHGEAKGPHKYISRTIPPYIIGVLLGDGCITGSTVSFCKPDREIAEKVQRLVTEAFGESVTLRESNTKDRAPAWFIPAKIAVPHLEDLGLMGLHSYEKFIPRIYLMASEEERWELLRGLMDTDGWVEEDGDCYYCSTSPRLIEDVRHLARSMGAIVTLREKTPHYTYKGEYLEGRPAQTLRIKMREPERMFCLPRKADRCRGKEPQSMAIWLDSIEPAGEEETVCIAVSHPNSLYIIKDFIVTHNTDAMLGDFVTHAGKYGEDAIGLCVRRERTQLKEMIERSRQIYSPLGSKYSSQDKQWRFPNGARFTFAYLENDADAEAYQGWNTCVSVGTRIKMADGSLKPIESISRGEAVLTLEGPRSVKSTIKPYSAECVQVTIKDDAGVIIGQQVHPVWHPILTTSGVSSLRPDAQEKIPAWFSWDNGARGRIDVALHESSLRSWPPQTWTHPYTGEEHPLEETVRRGTADFSLFGEALVSDLCVDSANHYISEFGVINKNTRVYVEEMGNFPRPEPIFKLMATLRSGNPEVKVGFRATANPGGPGANWIRARYIDPAPFGLKILTDKFINPFTKQESSIERVYIPSRVTDNKYCNNNDYIARLQLAAGGGLLHAWLHGDWSAVEGAFFTEWDMDKHVIAPFTIPDNWTRFMSADWGSAAPFSIGWWAVVSDDYGDVLGPMSYRADASAYQGDLPAGAIVRYREWYGSPNHNNVGLKLFAEEVAAGIVERERDEPRNDSGGARISYRVIDPDACREKGGPSIAERMSWKPNRVFWRAADNARVGRRGAMGGWDAVRARLKGENGVPMLYVFNNCVDLIRCLPVAQHDPDNMEDIDDCEDHCFHGDTLVSTPDGPVKIRELPESGVVNTPVGPKEYHGARLFFHNEATVKLSFSDGSEAMCTPDHEFLTTIGWIPASSIINREVISINDGKLNKIACVCLCDSGKTDVYCLTVPDAGCFLLADGKIVANCIDDLRYACMSRPFISSADAAKKDKYLTIGPDNRVTLNDILEQYDHRTPKSYERIR
jgi:LAGLIDADG-like domain